MIKKKAVFIIQIGENTLKVVQCLVSGLRREFSALEALPVTPQPDERYLASQLGQALQRMEYAGQPVVVSLPRNQATCRYLKVPTQSKQEIERIVSLQAAKYLPYPPEELITGFEIIRRDREGYSEVNLNIVHKDVVSRYASIFRELNIKNFSVYLSSYGLSNLYAQLHPQANQAAMLAEIDNYQAELVVVSQGKMLFSRLFRLDSSNINWPDAFFEEVVKSRDAYLKDVPQEKPARLFFCGAERMCRQLAQLAASELAPQFLPYTERVNYSRDALNSVVGSGYSFAGLVGFGLKDCDDSLNLLPADIRARIRAASRQGERLRSGLMIGAVALVWFLGLAKSMDNKKIYLARLKEEVAKVSAEAAPLEEVDRRLKALEAQSAKKASALDMIYDLYRIVPAEIKLSGFSFEDANQLSMRGTAPELESVFNFASALEKSPAFRNFQQKVKFATKKKTSAGEVIDFEIACSKK